MSQNVGAVMGGYGSGRRTWGAKRPSTDEALALDVRLLAQSGRLSPGVHAVSWPSVWGETTIAYSITDPETLDLAYRTRASIWGEEHDVRLVVRLARTPCPFGGARPWFLCPSCERRVAVLYLLAGVFRCRRCHSLAYASTREDASRRPLRRANRLRAQLEGEPAFGVIPTQPSWMTWRRYARTVERIVALDEAYAAGVLPQIEALERQVHGT